MQLLLRTVRRDGTPLNSNAAATGFKWPVGPSAVGQVVTAPDWWRLKKYEGGGLHGLLWGQGDVSHLRVRRYASIHPLEWQVVEVAEGSPIVTLPLLGCVKTQSVIIRFSGPDPIAACTFLKQHLPEGVVPDFDAVGDGDRTLAVGGSGIALAGKGGMAISGKYGLSEAGDGGTAISGGYAYSKNGGLSIVFGDRGGTAFTLDGGISIAGKFGHARAGKAGTARAGVDGNALAGDEGTAIVAFKGRAAAGKGGTIVLTDKSGETHTFKVDGVKFHPCQYYKWSEKQGKPYTPR